MLKNIPGRAGHWFSAGLLMVLFVNLYSPASLRNPTAADPDALRVAVVYYHVVADADDAWLEPEAGSLPRSAEPMRGALNLMARLPRRESPLPRGARARSVTLREDGVAWADFNAAFVRHFPGGSLQESLTLAAVTRTLKQFPGVRAVQFTVENQRIESLGGHEDLSEPLPVPED